MKLKEHIDLLQKLHIPNKKQVFRLAFLILNDHYNPIDKTLHDDRNGSAPRMTVPEFLAAITTIAPAPAPVQAIKKAKP